MLTKIIILIQSVWLSCCLYHQWDALIESNTLTINTNYSNFVVIAPFINIKSSNSPMYALSIPSILQTPTSHGLDYSEIYIQTMLRSISQTDITVEVYSAYPGLVDRMVVRYLVVDNQFQYLSIAHVSFSTSGTYYSYPGFFSYQYIQTNYSVSPNDTIVPIFSGYHLRNLIMGSYIFSLEVECTVNSGNLQYRIHNPLNITLMAIYFGLQVVIVHGQMGVELGGSLVVQEMQMLENEPFYANTFLANIYNQNLLFYGVSLISKTSQTATRINFNIYESVSTTIIYGEQASTKQAINFTLMYFQTQVSCPSGSIWDNITFACVACPSGSFSNSNTNSCESCSTVANNCTNCTFSSCLACVSPLVPYSSSCVDCEQIFPYCIKCNTSICQSCDTYHYLAVNNIECIICSGQYPSCEQCNRTACFGCFAPYKIVGGICQPNCSYVQDCLTCQVSNSVIVCQSCDFNMTVSNGACLHVCGDGILSSAEHCDDGNIIDRDGCSSSCFVEEYFICTVTVGAISSCFLTSMNMTTVALAKTKNKNEFVLSLDLSPQNLVMYQIVNWGLGFQNYSHNIHFSWSSLDENGKRLRVGFNYQENLVNNNVFINVNLAAITGSIFMASNVQVIPIHKDTSNNLALYYFEESAYNLNTIATYLSIFISAFSLLLFGAGYFGSKLQSIEAVAVVQVSALLLVTQENMGPAFEGLRSLRLSMGITPLFEGEYYYEDSSIPSHIASVLSSRDSVGLFNIFLLVLFVPLVTALVLKVLSVTACEGHWAVERAWKYSLGSFLFYGLLFLAYGLLASLALGLRHFEASVSSGMGVLAGALFLAMLVLWGIATFKYPTWFGSFKSKFFKFQISQHFYAISAAERVLTALFVVSLSPGLVGAGLAALIFTAEGIFILVKKPYILGTWKRPLLNKVGAALISLLFVGAAVTQADSTINQIIPLVILLILAVVLVVATIGAVSQIHEYWSMRQEKFEVVRKAGPPLTVQESHKILLKEFQQKMMPKFDNMPSIWRPVEHEHVDIEKWKWQNYPVLHTYDVQDTMRERLRKVRRKEIKQVSQQEQEAEINIQSIRKNFNEL